MQRLCFTNANRIYSIFNSCITSVILVTSFMLVWCFDFDLFHIQLSADRQLNLRNVYMYMYVLCMYVFMYVLCMNVCMCGQTPALLSTVCSLTWLRAAPYTAFQFSETGYRGRLHGHRNGHDAKVTIHLHLVR